MKQLHRKRRSYRLSFLQFDTKMKLSTILFVAFFNLHANTPHSIVDKKINLSRNEKPDQTWKVSGTILDATGQPLPGASVLEKNTKNAVQTDFDGKFSINVSNKNAVLVFSYIGYVSQEVAVKEQTSLKITLKEDMASLEEVVVIGYGTQKKALVTGANLQVDGSDIARTSTVNALQALQGQAAGVQITSTSGQPGEGLKVNIRGLGSTIGSSPLYVVDGMVIGGDISYLSNSDIESISVLKDAASAAIYGAQASNGVILVTTKKGKRGSVGQITFDQYYGLQSVARKVDLLNATEYATIINETAVNSGKAPFFTNEAIAQMGEGTNWMDKMFVDNAITKNYSLGISGGSDTSVYSGALSYLGQEGVVGGKDLSNYGRYNFRFNSEHKLYKDVVTFGENLSFAYIDRNGIGVGNQYNNSLRSAFSVSPLQPFYDENGNFFSTVGYTEPWLDGSSNPYAVMFYGNQNESNNQKLIGNVYLQVEPIKGLTLKTTLGLDYYAGEGHSYNPIYEKLSKYTGQNDYSSVSQNMNKGKSIIWDNLLTYKFNVADNHNFTTMIGSSSIRSNGTFINGTNADAVFNDLDHAWLGVTTNSESDLMSVGGGKTENFRMSYFGRLSYNFKETYLLNATFRADGSSNFGPGHKWGYFPSVSAGWVMTNENFLSGSENLNFFKLRASWGQVGNQNVGAFQYLATIKSTQTNYSFGNEEGVLTPGAYPDRLANPELQWETSEQIDLGFDAKFLKNALSVNFDWYRKTNKGWLILAPVLATAGANPPFINGGNVINQGVELALQYQNNIGDFNYTIAANGAYNENTVGKIPTVDGRIHGLTNQIYANAPEFYRAEDGFPLGYFWGYKTAGVYQNQQQIDDYGIQPNATPGDVIYQDINNDGKISDADKTMVGNPNPDFTFGFSLSANYKAFDFLISANGVAGNQIAQSYRSPGAYGNYTTAILDRWHGEGTSNRVPKLTDDSRNFAQFSDLYLQDGDFLRINTVTIGFDIAKLKMAKPFFASQFRLYASVLNLYTFTKYDGMDPEIGFGPSDTGSTNPQAFSSGVDVGYYPRPRTFMMGLNVKL
jgi:TonB-linked SusC/RagA family outer membrane protein